MISAVLLSLAGATTGQTNLETNAGIQFNFSTPGAGNLALGGAFLALADDATAAYTNPAGLTNILEPEVMIEGRSWGYTHMFTDRGRLEGRPPTGTGLDTIAGLEDGEAENDVTGLSFLSYVYPRKKWAIAFYRHELANFEADFTTRGAFLELTRSRSPLGFPFFLDGRLASLRNAMKLEIANYGVSTAFKLGETLSIGLGAAYYELSIDSTAERFTPNLFDPPDFSQAPASFQSQTGDDSDLSFIVGCLWQGAGQKWSAGGVYRAGPDFSFDATSQSGPATPPFAAFAESQRARFHVPAVYGLGLGFRPTGTIRISFDYNRIEYSDLTRDFVDIFNVGELFGLDPELDAFKVDDVDELHLGFEYTYLGWTSPFNIRVGAWHEPDHSLHYEGERSGLQAVYRRRDDELHYTAGFGVSRGRYQIDAAFDYSERISTASLSAIFRF